jgi:hypothetical protein
MDIRSDQEFLAWLAEAGIGVDPRFPHSDRLVFTASPDLSRFWLPNQVPSELPGFLLTAVRAATAGGGCWIHLRGGGRWYAGEQASSREVVIERMLPGSGIEPGVTGAVHYLPEEWQPLLVALIAHYTLGWQVGNDVHIVPDNRSCVLMVGHHGELSCQCPDRASLNALIAAMASAGFELPDHLPDATFKVPERMPPASGTT